MRLRTLAAATLLTLQALVASRPFVASATMATVTTTAVTTAHAGGAHEGARHTTAQSAATSSAQPDCHHAASGGADQLASSSDRSTSQEAPPVSPPSHDHGESACHAGTPCCAPTLPVPAIELSVATLVASRSSLATPAVVVRARDVARRQPPATAPPRA